MLNSNGQTRTFPFELEVLAHFHRIRSNARVHLSTSVYTCTRAYVHVHAQFQSTRESAPKRKCPTLLSFTTALHSSSTDALSITNRYKPDASTVNPLGPSLFSALTSGVDPVMVRRCRRVRGDVCDTCGVASGPSSSDGAAVKLQFCIQCKKRWYCSVACQKKAWKGLHKAACRAQGVFKPDDLALIHGLKSKPELNGEVCKIVHETKGSDGQPRWVVHVMGQHEAQLKLRPASLDYLLDDGAV